MLIQPPTNPPPTSRSVIAKSLSMSSAAAPCKDGARAASAVAWAVAITLRVCLTNRRASVRQRGQVASAVAFGVVSVAASAEVVFEEEGEVVVGGLGMGMEVVEEEVWDIRMEAARLRDLVREVEEEEGVLAGGGMVTIAPLAMLITSLFRLAGAEGIVIVTMVAAGTAADRSARMRAVGTRSLGRAEGIDGMACHSPGCLPAGREYGKITTPD